MEFAPASVEIRTNDSNADLDAVVTKRFKASEAKQIEEIAALYSHSDDLLIYRSGRITRGWPAYETYWKSAMSHLPTGFQVNFTNVSIRNSAAEGYATAEWTTSYKAEDGHDVVNNGLMTLILDKTPDGWRIVHEHISDKK